MSAKDIGAWAMCARTAPISWAPISSSELEISPIVASPLSKVVINVSGRRYETYDYTLLNHKHTLLGGSDKKYFYDEKNREYYFDRDPDLFRFVLNYYRTGKLHYPKRECTDYFEKELGFFGIKISDITECCFDEYWKKKNECDIKLTNESKKPEILIGNYERKMTLREKIWRWLENPQSAWIGKFFYYVTGLFITLSVCCTVFETVECDKGFSCGKKYKDLFFMIETCCVVVFTAEYIARLYGAPNRLLHARSVPSIIDIIAILPYFVGLFMAKTVFGGAFISLRVFRVFRIFKFSRHSKGLRILGYTLMSCASELGFLLFSLSMAVIIFSTVIYYTEKDEKHTHFTSIPASFWYTVVTMTTLGYGDMVPKTVLGKLVGSVCSLCGVLVIALPVPVIVTSFSKIYMRNQRSDRRMANLEYQLNDEDSVKKESKGVEASIADLARQRMTNLSNAYSSIMDLNKFGKDMTTTKAPEKILAYHTSLTSNNGYKAYARPPKLKGKRLLKREESVEAQSFDEDVFEESGKMDQLNVRPLIVVDLIDDRLSI